MNLALNIIDWQARAPGLSDTAQWREWACQHHVIDPDAPQAKLTELPMMTARRLSSGSRLAVECGMAMLRRHSIDAVLYTSRHGELERNYRILHALATGQAVSPPILRCPCITRRWGISPLPRSDRLSRHHSRRVLIPSSKACAKWRDCCMRAISVC